MKKILIAVLLSLGLFAFTAQANLLQKDFFGIPWGSSPDKIITDTQGTLQPDGNITSDFKSSDGQEVNVMFEMKNKKLVKAVLIVKAQSKDPMEIAKFCDQNMNKMVELSGPPDFKTDSEEMGLMFLWSNPITQVENACLVAEGVYVTIWQPTSDQIKKLKKQQLKVPGAVEI